MEYISVKHQKALAERYRLACILAFAFGVSVGVFILIGRLLPPGEPQPGSEKWQPPVYAGVIVLGLMIVILRRVLMSRQVVGQATMAGVGAVLNKLVSVTIISLVAAEMVAIVGLVLYQLSADYQYSWRLGVVSLMLIAYSFPRRGEWERAVIAAAKARPE